MENGFISEVRGEREILSTYLLASSEYRIEPFDVASVLETSKN